MKVVPDANILISANANRGLCRQLMQQLIENVEVCLSEYILVEVAAVLCQKFNISDSIAARAMMEYRNNDAVTMVEPVMVPVGACRDQDDLPVLGTAIASGADFIVTGDADLFDLKNYRGVVIITPRQMLDLINKTSDDT